MLSHFFVVESTNRSGSKSEMMDLIFFDEKIVALLNLINIVQNQIAFLRGPKMPSWSD